MRMWTKAAVAGFAVIACTVLMLMRASGQPDAPQQPIEFDHWQHVSKEDGPQVECVSCHEHAESSSRATVPNISTCMACHETEKTESPQVQRLSEMAARGEQPAWVRVYSIEDSADAFFTHKPHARAGLDCSACHGQVAQMRRVRREVVPSMSWCIECHRARGASVDCYACHR